MIAAPTGAGKTTRVPPAILDSGLAGSGLVVMLEPRRLAARAAARRMAADLISTIRAFEDLRGTLVFEDEPSSFEAALHEAKE